MTNDGPSDRDAPAGDATEADKIAPAVSPGLPEDTFPGYEIVRELHRGGQGVVYQAIQ